MNEHFIYVPGFHEPIMLDGITDVEQLRETIAGTAKNPLHLVNVPRGRGRALIRVSAIVGFETRPV